VTGIADRDIAYHSVKEVIDGGRDGQGGHRVQGFASG
jgi:hypothetical protein